MFEDTSTRGRESRAATPQLTGIGAHPPPSPAYDEYSMYEERDLGINYTSYEWNRAGPSSSVGPRSSYGSPTPYMYRPSYDGGFYLPPRSPAPSSAPARYPPYSQPVYYSQDTLPGAFPDAYSEPNPHDWYNPPSDGHYSEYRPTPPSIQSSLPHTYTAESIPRFFGVSAPHHHPGFHRTSQRGAEELPYFPSWSRAWYDGHHSADGHAYTMARPPSGISGWESETLTHSGAYPKPYGNYGRREGVADIVKEERMQMLEKEFGKPKVSHRDQEEDEDDVKVSDVYDEDEDLPIGAVTSRGKLITERPKWDIAIRWLIGLTSLAAFACGIGGAVLIKPGKNAPKAVGSIPAYILYALSVISLIIILYLYVIRPCCCDPMRKEIKRGDNPMNPMAGMVVPILGGGAPGKMKRGRGPFGRKRGMMQPPTPTVNLIVDPTFLNGRTENKHRDHSDSEDDERLPGDARRSSRRKNGVGVLGNMQMQRRWTVARRSLKIQTTWDCILCIAWIAVSIIALGFGQKCPPGGGNGWCNYYNAAIACGVIQAVWLLCAIYLDYRNLTISKRPPKPPL